jgi:hypothetical protein
MSSTGTAAVSFPIRFADIIFAEVLDPNGQNPKTRRVVVLTPDSALALGFPIVVAGVTSTLPNPLARHTRAEVGQWASSAGRHPPLATRVLAGFARVADGSGDAC